MTSRLDNLRRQVEEIREVVGIQAKPPKGYPYLPPGDVNRCWISAAHYLEYQRLGKLWTAPHQKTGTDTMELLRNWCAYADLHSVKSQQHPVNKHNGVPQSVIDMITEDDDG